MSLFFWKNLNAPKRRDRKRPLSKNQLFRIPHVKKQTNRTLLNEKKSNFMTLKSHAACDKRFPDS